MIEMTQDIFEMYDFELKHKGIDSWFIFKKSPIVDTDIQNYYGYKPYNLFLNYGFHDGKMKIRVDFSGGLNFDKSDTIFEGFIYNSNEFQVLLKFLKITQQVIE